MHHLIGFREYHYHSGAFVISNTVKDGGMCTESMTEEFSNGHKVQLMLEHCVTWSTVDSHRLY